MGPSIGVIGAQSRHAWYFGRALMELRPGGGPPFSRIWGGDSPGDLAEYLKEFPGVEGCDTPDELIERSDAVIVALRDGKKHLFYAAESLERGKPVFVDKPFACSPADAKQIAETSKRTRTPFTGGSTFCFLPEIADIKKRCGPLDAVSISYKADWDSPFGGWYFYGSHLTDLCAALCGTGAYCVKTRTEGKFFLAEVTYPGKAVTLRSAPDLEEPAVEVDGRYVLSDSGCYAAGMRAFLELVEDGRSRRADELEFSVCLMDAIQKSVRAGGGTMPVIYP